GCWLREAQRELHAEALHALVVEPAGRRDGGRRQQLKRLLPQAQLATARREYAVGMRQCASRRDGAAGRHLEIARVDALLVVRKLRADERAVNVRFRIEHLEQRARWEAEQH